MPLNKKKGRQAQAQRPADNNFLGTTLLCNGIENNSIDDPDYIANGIYGSASEDRWVVSLFDTQE